MKKILIAFLMFTLSGPAFADDAGSAGDLEEQSVVELETLDIVGENLQSQPALKTQEVPAKIKLDEKHANQLRPQNNNTNNNTNAANNNKPTQTPTDQRNTDALQDKVNAARENETSWENKLNDAIGIGGVGIGGMMIGGALAERNADDDAESSMRAYLETFRCEYGNGQHVDGGVTNVEIPGGNDLIDLYSRYATLANDLKLRKESLGIKPGIESEVVIDKATTGLYDDVGTGVVGGGYASIARAIMNPTGADAQMWAEQRAKTSSKLNTGIGIASAAAALTLGKTIADELKKPKEPDVPGPFTITQPEEQPNYDCARFNKPDADYKLTGQFPYCNCVVGENNELENNLVFNVYDKTCSECTGGQEPVTTDDGFKKCQCPPDKPHYDSVKGCLAECPIKDDPNNHLMVDGSCKPHCLDGYNKFDEESKSCSCTGDGMKVNKDNGMCEKTVMILRTEREEIKDLPSLPSDTLFDISKSDFKKNAKTEINKWVKQNIIDLNRTNCILNVVGHADRTGEKNYNDTLSTQRAETVAKYLKTLDDLKTHLANDPSVIPINSSGVGFEQCYCCQDDSECPAAKEDKLNKNNGVEIKQCTPDETKVPDKQYYAPCRRVEIRLKCAPMKRVEISEEIVSQ